MNFLLLIQRGIYTLFILVTLFNFVSDYVIWDLLILTLIIGIVFYEVILYTSSNRIKISDLENEYSKNKQSTNNKLQTLLGDKFENCLDNNKYDEDFLNIIRYLLRTNEYLSPNYTLSDLEKGYGLSKRKMSYIIHTNVGCSFTNLIAKLRINYAKNLINAQTSYTFEHLSSKVGFCSRSSFNKYFKYFEGVTPKEYKLNLS